MNRMGFAAILGVSLLSLISVACGGGEATPPPTNPSSATPSPATPSPATPALTTFEAQVAEGQKLYGANCASCHGASGEGGKAPAVVGVTKGALPLDPPPNAKFRKAQFKTAADVAGFVVKNMPPGDAGKLTEEQYWAILAFDLKANGVDLKQKLDASTAPSVAIH